MNPSCWCGNTELQRFSPEYLRCARCETLVAGSMPREEALLPGKDESGFYGREYFDEYQVRQLHLPPITERARTDLPERCLYWLKTLLSYKLPPARTLEIGCFHGGFVGLLRWAGFDAQGQELSPWVAGFANSTFGVPVLTGPVEEQPLEPASLDAVVMMDVLEHLPDPLRTVRRCLSLLKPDGLLMIQTPAYPEGQTLEEMQASGHAFTNMLLPQEHLYLFSQSSVRRLLSEAGAGHVAFEKALFQDYDMFLVAGGHPPARLDGSRIAESLARCPSGRMALALLDLSDKFEDLTTRYEESEADRAARLEMAERNGRAAAEAEAQVQALHAQLGQLSEQLKESEADRAARLEMAERNGRAAVEAENRNQALHRQIEQMRTQLSRSEAECASGRQALQERDQRLAALERQLEAAQCESRVLHEKLEAEQSLLERRTAELAELEAQRNQWNEEVARYRGVHARLHQSLVFRAMRRLGLWSWLDVSPPMTFQGSALAPAGRRSAGLNHIVVDLTPVLPGGENGGAKLMTLELIENLSRMLPECRFTLLTSESSHEELAVLDAANIRRFCVKRATGNTALETVAAVAGPLYRRALGRMPASAAAKVEQVRRAVTARPVPGMLRDFKADLLFCPFTAPYYYDPAVPLVSVVYDLQYTSYPQFFSPEEIAERSRAFQDASRLSARVITISDYVRQTVLQAGNVDPARVTTIPIALARRVEPPPAGELPAILQRYGLRANGFMLYPANFWAHKNHEMLLTAFGIYRNTPGCDPELKLVLTGAPGPRQAELRNAAETMGLGGHVLFPGFVPDTELAGFLHACLAVVFPSLYEGFGIPVLEAMLLGKPVLCSNVTSLPEVAGDAALLFDPRKPQEIAAAMTRITAEPALARSLGEKGRRRAAAFGGPREMAAAYLSCFREVAAARSSYSSAIHGLYSDGWCGERTVFTFAPGPAGRTLVVDLSSPGWTPAESVWLTVLPYADWPLHVHSLARGQRKRLELPLPAEDGFIEFIYQPTVRPADVGLGDDTRALGFLLHSSRIAFPDGGTEILKPEENAC